METAKNVETDHEVVGVFETEKEFLSAANELYQEGVTHGKLEILADPKIVEKKLGHDYRNVKEIEDDVNAPRTTLTLEEWDGSIKEMAVTTPIYIGVIAVVAITAALGMGFYIILAATAISALIFAGFGMLLARFVDKRHSAYIKKQLDLGGLPLWVRLNGGDYKDKVLQVLKKHNAHDVHVH